MNSSESGLWCAVILRALRDASGNPDCCYRTMRDVEIKNARRWIMNGQDFLDVCAMAGLNGSVLRQKFRAGLVHIPKIETRGRKKAA